LTAQSTTTPALPSHRLEKALFWLRWFFLIGMVMLAVLAEDAVLGDTVSNQPQLLFSVGVGGSINILIGLATLSPQTGERTLGLVSTVLDGVLAVLFCWTFEGDIVPLVLLGTLATTAAAVRLGWFGVGLATAIVVVGSLLAIAEMGTYDSDDWTTWALSVAFLFVFGILGVIFRSSGLQNGGAGSADEDQSRHEAQRLRATRERAQAIFDMATALSASLDHQLVLSEAQNIGLLGLRDQLGENVRLVSAVMLFQGDDNQLRIVTSRGLTRTDQSVALPGRRGVLGLALKQAEPVFGGDPARDPELRYFVGFQDTKSVLAIPLRAGIDVYGVMIFGSDQPNAFSDDHVELMTAIGTQSTLSLQNAVLYQNLKIEKEKIVEVEEDARKKLSRDLHDGPTQSVAAIAMRVNYIRRLIERQPQQAIEELWKVEELARRTTKEIRHMLFTLRPLVLETQGLLPALGQLADKMRDTHNTNVELQALPDVEDYLDTNAQGVLFYVIEEAVNNARKHAESEHIWVRLYHRDQRYVVAEIEDDGVGFDVQVIDSNYDQRGSLGMINMRERAELIEGTVRIHSAPGRGTKITVVVPAHPSGETGQPEGEAEPVPTLELQSHRSGTRSASEQGEPQPPYRKIAPDTAPLSMDTQPKPPVSSKATSAPDDAAAPASTSPTTPAPPAGSFASGGIERPVTPLSEQPEVAPAAPSDGDAGQTVDSFASGGFTQPAKQETSAPPDQQQRVNMPRVGRAKRPQTSSRPHPETQLSDSDQPEPETAPPQKKKLPVQKSPPKQPPQSKPHASAPKE
jgi:signal transduction histidine kinase